MENEKSIKQRQQLQQYFGFLNTIKILNNKSLKQRQQLIGYWQQSQTQYNPSLIDTIINKIKSLLDLN